MRRPYSSVREDDTYRRRRSASTAFVVQGGVGLDDLGLRDRQDPAGGLPPDHPWPRPGPPHRPGRPAGAATASRPGGRRRGRPPRTGTAPTPEGAGGSDRGCPRSRGWWPSPRRRARGRSRPGTAPAPTACPHHRPGPAGPTGPSAHRSASRPTPRAPPAPGPRPVDEPAPRPTRPPAGQAASRSDRSSFMRPTLGVTTDSRGPKRPCSTGSRETLRKFFWRRSRPLADRSQTTGGNPIASPPLVLARACQPDLGTARKAPGLDSPSQDQTLGYRVADPHKQGHRLRWSRQAAVVSTSSTSGAQVPASAAVVSTSSTSDTRHRPQAAARPAGGNPIASPPLALAGAVNPPHQPSEGTQA